MSDWSEKLGKYAEQTERNALRSLRKYRHQVEDVCTLCRLLADREQQTAKLAQRTATLLQSAIQEYLAALNADGRFTYGDKRRTRGRQTQISTLDEARLRDDEQDHAKECFLGIAARLRQAVANGQLAVLIWLGPDRASCDTVFWDQVQVVLDELETDFELLGWNELS